MATCYGLRSNSENDNLAAMTAVSSFARGLIRWLRLHVCMYAFRILDTTICFLSTTMGVGSREDNMSKTAYYGQNMAKHVDTSRPDIRDVSTYIRQE